MPSPKLPELNLQKIPIWEFNQLITVSSQDEYNLISQSDSDVVIALSPGGNRIQILEVNGKRYKRFLTKNNED